MSVPVVDARLHVVLFMAAYHPSGHLTPGPVVPVEQQHPVSLPNKSMHWAMLIQEGAACVMVGNIAIAHTGIRVMGSISFFISQSPVLLWLTKTTKHLVVRRLRTIVGNCVAY